MASKFLLIKPNQAACKLCFFPRTADLNSNQAFVYQFKAKNNISSFEGRGIFQVYMIRG